jgi:hypothetical protein
MPVDQPVVRRKRLCLAGGSVEPLVSAEQLATALSGEDIETWRPLLPVADPSVVQAYRDAAAELCAQDLTDHYTTGRAFFYDQFVPQLKARLSWLTGGAWSASDLGDFVAYAAGTDVDLMAHVIEAVAADSRVSLYPGDWFGFLVGSPCRMNIEWSHDASGRLACLCVPSVRNGHVTDEMLSFLDSSRACLLNLNLFPTLTEKERLEYATQLRPLLGKSLLSISFSRGFGLTASQLGVILLPRRHPYVTQFHEQWSWFTYFYNALAARAFLRLDLAHLQRVHDDRRQRVCDWIVSRGLPCVRSGSYYVKSFAVRGSLPEHLHPLQRDGLVRLCPKRAFCE